MNIHPIIELFPGILPDPLSQGIIVPVHLAIEVATYLRNSPDYTLDYASNVTGVDYLPREETVRTENPDGTFLVRKKQQPGYFEVVYHLYSMSKKWGPLVLKQRTRDRERPVVASLTLVYRSAEFQEREIYDLFGVHFEGHPDLRRILMWDEFEGHPMRKDYIEPDDYQYEPTPHGEVLKKARRHYP